MESAIVNDENISERLSNAILELRQLQGILLPGEVDPLILTEFRDVLNRTRNTAWAVQQYLDCKVTKEDSASVLNLLVRERIRTAYKLGQAIAEDLRRPDVQLQTGQLLQLYELTKALTEQLAELVG